MAAGAAADRSGKYPSMNAFTSAERGCAQLSELHDTKRPARSSGSSTSAEWNHSVSPPWP